MLSACKVVWSVPNYGISATDVTCRLGTVAMPRIARNTGVAGFWNSSIPRSYFTIVNTEAHCTLALDGGALDQDIAMFAMHSLDPSLADNTSLADLQAKNPLAAFRDLSELMASIFTAPKITSIPDLPG